MSQINAESIERKKALCEQIKIELLRRKAKESYVNYVEYVHRGKWLRGKAVGYICIKLQEFLLTDTSNPYDILVVSMPPQHGKSMTITATLPSWYLGRFPIKRVIGISYSEGLAMQFGRRNREKIQEYGKNLFNVLLASSPCTSTEFETTQKGSMISRGIMSGVTGRACDLMIIDDPIKNRMEADSETYRDRLFGEWENSFKTRLSAGAKVIIIQTRWHEDDLAGRIIAREKNVTVINLPCECENEQADPLGRQKGDALAPEIGKNNEWLASFKESYAGVNGSRAWNALFQGKPSQEQGNIIKRQWWKFYSGNVNIDYLILSVDASFKSAEDNDNVAIQVWGKKDSNVYLLYAIKEHLDFPETVKQIMLVKSQFVNIKSILIEDKANGSAIIQLLRKTIPGIIPVEPKGGKIARVNAVSGVIEAGNVYLPEDKEFTSDFIDECSAFPNGKHDDQVDCMSQALNKLIYIMSSHHSTNNDVVVEGFNVKLSNSKNKIGKGDKNHVI